MVSKAQQIASRKYNSKAYDRLSLVVKKGQKNKINEKAKQNDMSTNAYINSLIQNDKPIPKLYAWTTCTSFEIFKSNVLHTLKNSGDIDFLKTAIEEDIVTYFFDKKLIKEALYILALIDMLSKENEIPLWNKYDNYRALMLSETIWPNEVYVLNKLTNSDKYFQDAKDKALPEFLKYNIVEVNIRDVC